MKIGDLVRWRDVHHAWHLARGIGVISDNRKRGIIFQENEKYVFIHWEDGAQRAEERNWVELINENRRLD